MGKHDQSSGDFGETEYTPFDWQRLISFGARLRAHFLLLLLLLAIGAAMGVGYYFVAKPTFTAVALISPAGPSPTSALLGGGSSGGAVSLARRVFGGGGGSGGNDNFQEYLHLLPSLRTAQVLAEKEGMLQTVFHAAWDDQKHQWRQPGAIGSVKRSIKKWFGLRVGGNPDADALSSYIAENLDVNDSSPGITSIFAPATFIEVSFKADDPTRAEYILDQIMLESDNIVRGDQKKNVTSRIAFLRKELSGPSASVDERTSLISILSEQEQLLAMIQADHRYAITLVLPPHSPSKPAYKIAPGRMMALVPFGAILIWVLLVGFGTQYGVTRNFVEWFRDRRLGDVFRG